MYYFDKKKYILRFKLVTLFLNVSFVKHYGYQYSSKPKYKGPKITTILSCYN